MKETALITGSSSGIGLHLAREFASHGHPLVLVAPDREELEAVAADVRAEFGSPVRVIAANLELAPSCQEVFEHLQKESIKVDILVNNAGHGYRGKTWELEIDKDLSMVRLNIEAVLRLTKLFLPPMIERGRGRIMITASVAGFQAGPMVNVYHSTKAFVLSFAEALSVELEGTGISVTALCPGPTDTDFFPKAGMEGVVAFQKGNLMAPQDVARAGFEGVMDGELIVIPGALNKVMVAGRRVLTEHAQAIANSKMYEEVDKKDRLRRRGDMENP